mgnify:CR=1 FL=1
MNCQRQVEMKNMEKYLKETTMLDYSNEKIQKLIKERKWNELDEFECIRDIYNFVRDEILFGYNIDDSLPASKVLADGFGQCNTKGTLFMALLRACNIPCRIHGFMIDKKLQKGAMTGIVYKNAPQKVFHSWVEVYHENQWYELEGYILDIMYLRKLQNKNKKCTGTFCGYGVDVKDFKIRPLTLTEIIHISKARELLRISEYMIHPTIYFKYIIRKCQQLKHLCISIWAGI